MLLHQSSFEKCHKACQNEVITILKTKKILHDKLGVTTFNAIQYKPFISALNQVSNILICFLIGSRQCICKADIRGLLIFRLFRQLYGRFFLAVTYLYKNQFHCYSLNRTHGVLKFCECTYGRRSQKNRITIVLLKCYVLGLKESWINCIRLMCQIIQKF